jgi:hypothetical protein
VLFLCEFAIGLFAHELEKDSGGGLVAFVEQLDILGGFWDVEEFV